ncbi:MFS general substrate transporter [Zopfia rhizophila CBS 207.26]|uniref:MFS general substrate transporter n=1 Tax=Zopfia rhizophila CBS 207.26 TaxID=1314779 RepID=A0A6A6EGU5_9PEZI|nr:MFS general substrate transporter [Zopfia rhizophila CBS 207.26]
MIESSTADKNYGYPLWRKCLIVFVCSWMTLSATFSSTSLFSASSEIATEFATRTASVNISSAGVLLAMAFSTFVWGPIGSIAGRRMSYNACAVVLFLFAIGAAVAPSMASFAVTRILSGLQGTYFHVAGQAILAEYFPPVQRGTATGLFLAGTVLGPPLGPCTAGIIVTFADWRVILWVQAAMIGLGFILSILCIPYSAVHDDTSNRSKSFQDIVGEFNPAHVFSLMVYPNVLLTDLTCGLLSWSQYSLLSAPRHLISTRFHLTSPLVSGLFYIAPAAGFLVGTMVGGRYSDWTVKKWIVKRGGDRLPQDRLNSGMFSFFILIPAASLIYGWGLECTDCAPGSLALPIITGFFIAAGLLAAFASLNTYSAEVLPQKRTEVIAGKYCVQYIFSACSSAASVPLADLIGAGPASIIGTVFILVGGSLTLLVAKRGLAMQHWIGEKSKEQSFTAKLRFHQNWLSDV